MTKLKQALFLWIGMSVGWAHAQGPPAPPSAAASEFRTQVEALLASGPIEVHGVRVAHPKLIHEFYSRRSFRPAWTDARTASELRRAVTDSEADGLDPRDYHSAALQQLADGSAPAAYEILNTDALLRLADHLTFGKVDPTSFEPHWNYAHTVEDADIPQKIESAIAKGDIYAEIEKLKPTHRWYRTLKQELARIRLIAASNERVTVAAGKPIELDTHDLRVPSLRTRLSISGDLVGQDSSSDLYDPALQAAVRNFQERMGLTPDGKVGAATIAELNVPIEDRIRQLRINLDRGRILLHELPQEFVVVNIAAYWLYFVRGDDIVWDTRVQVGKTYRRTPMFRSAIDYLVLNPTWTVPPGIIRNDILPAARRDPASITRRGLKVLDASGNEVDPQSIDWSKYKGGNIPYTLRQEPGPKNALGRVKFMFPNSYSVYLHDTPASDKFEAADRAFSSGCVRVDRPLELAVLLLANTSAWNAQTVRQTIEGGRTQNITLPSKMPVLLAYWTSWVDPKGRVNFRRDVYGQDAEWAAGLDREYTARTRNRTKGP